MFHKLELHYVVRCFVQFCSSILCVLTSEMPHMRREMGLKQKTKEKRKTLSKVAKLERWLDCISSYRCFCLVTRYETLSK